jgi:hypothetical protein
MWCVGRDSQHDLGLKPPTFGDGGDGSVAGYGAGGVGGAVGGQRAGLGQESPCLSGGFVSGM